MFGSAPVGMHRMWWCDLTPCLTACELDAGNRPGSCQKHDQIALLCHLGLESSERAGQMRAVLLSWRGQEGAGFALPGHTVSCDKSYARAVGEES